MKNISSFALCLVFGLGVTACFGIWWGIQAKRSQTISPEAVQTLKSSCEGDFQKARISCLRKGFTKMLTYNTLENVMDSVVLATYGKTDPDTRYNSPRCHELAHVVGKAAVEVAQRNPAELVIACGFSCVYGCVHGVFGGLLQKNTITTSNLSTLCESNRSLSHEDKASCVHGAGHGLAEYYGHALPQALDKCKQFKTSAHKKECWGGVLMEAYAPIGSQALQKRLPNDLLSLCRSQDIDFQTICIETMVILRYKVPTEVASVLKCNNALEGFDACSNVPNASLIGKNDEQTILIKCAAQASILEDCIDRSLQEERIESKDFNFLCQGDEITNQLACKEYLEKRMQISRN